MSPRVLPCDRVRYAATVAGLLAAYGAIWVMDVAAQVMRRRRLMMDGGRYPWEGDDNA